MSYEVVTYQKVAGPAGAPSFNSYVVVGGAIQPVRFEGSTAEISEKRAHDDVQREFAKIRAARELAQKRADDMRAAAEARKSAKTKATKAE